MKVSYVRVKEAVKALNESGIIENTIKLVAVKKETVINNFMGAVIESADEDGNVHEKMPDLCLDVYNELVDEVESEEAEKETKKEDKKETKKEDKKETKKEDKKKLNVFEDPKDPRYPFVQKLLKEGVSIDEIKAREFIGEALLKDPDLGVPELTEMLTKERIKVHEFVVMDTWSKCLFLMNF